MHNPPDASGVRSQRTWLQKLLAFLKRYWFLYLLVLPGFVFMIVFNYGPMYGIQLAFKDYHANLGIWGSPWVGLEHFREMIADAKEEGQDRIAKYFDMVNKVEEVHANLYKKALADPSSITGDLYVCTVCGYTQEGPCDKCPICGAVAAAFAKID